MATSTTQSELPGYALLVAAEAPMRHPFAVTSVLSQLAAVPPAHLVGAPYASAVQLASPEDPNVVLTHLRTAAAIQGPLLVYVAGHLVVDSRQRRLHLALARTTARTVRYTALPWHWLVAELQQRPPGSTTVVADLAADTDVWQALVQHEQSLDGPFTLYGTVQLQDKHRRPTPSYTNALAQFLRMAPQHPGLEELHHHVARAAAVENAATVRLGGQHLIEQPPLQGALPAPADVPRPRPEPATATPQPALIDDPHRAVFEAAAAGRHAEAAAAAAAQEQEALRVHGPESPEAVHWIEVQAELARQAGDPARASRLWLRSAVIRLSTGQSETDADVTAAVDRAHYCWHAVTDSTEIKQLGTELLSLRTRVTGKSGARADIQRRLAKLSQTVHP